jgi:hypothetical protein
LGAAYGEMRFACGFGFFGCDFFVGLRDTNGIPFSLHAADSTHRMPLAGSRDRHLSGRLGTLSAHHTLIYIHTQMHH